MMVRIGFVLALAAVLVAGGAAGASDPVGGYLIVDKVILEPSEAPTKIQIWGTVVLATRRGGNEFSSPQRGYLYYKAPSGKEDICRKEWNDLKKSAGTGQVIGFGTSGYVKGQGTIRKTSQKPERPDTYPVGNGLVRVEDDRDYKPVRDLLTLPVTRSPAEGDTVSPGQVTLIAGKMADTKRTEAKYVFEIVGPNGDKEKATAEAGKKEAKWTPKMKLKAGEKYTWRVWATEGKWEGPVASATFVVKDS